MYGFGANFARERDRAATLARYDGVEQTSKMIGKSDDKLVTSGLSRVMDSAAKFPPPLPEIEMSYN